MSGWQDFTFSSIAYRVSDISDIAEILPFFFWLRSKDRREPFLILAMYFLSSGTLSLYGLLTAKAFIYNMHLYHIWAVIQAICIYMFYRSLWGKTFNFWFVLSVFVVYLSSSLWFQKIDSMNSLCWTVNTILIIYLGTTHFYKLYHDDSITGALAKRPDFIITAGWLVYAAGSLFTYLMGRDILVEKAEGFFRNAWMFQSVSNIIKTGASCYAFWLLRGK